MNLTTTQNKVHEDNVSKEARPHTYEMRHYPHDGLLEQLAFMLIRPPRFVYNPDILQPSKRMAQRFSVETLMVPFEVTLYKQKTMDYVLLYLHGNGSSCFEGTLFLSCLPDRVGLACFDFKGCGNRSEGDFITLGQQQAKDVDTVAKYLKSEGYRVVGWGRSMGGVSLLMSEQCDLMVVDSAYSNLAQLCKESSSKFLPRACCCIFHCLFPCVFACIQCKVQSLAGLSIDRMDVTARMRQLSSNKQVCFIQGEDDALVPPHHANQLHSAFRGRKKLILFEGTHNSIRPKEVLQRCFEFIEDGLRQPEVREAMSGNHRLMEMAELPSQSASRQQPQIQQKLQLLEHSPNNHRKILAPLPKTYAQGPPIQLTSSPIKPIRPNDEEYCQIGPEGRLPINETRAEEQLLQKQSKPSEEQDRRLRQANEEKGTLRP